VTASSRNAVLRTHFDLRSTLASGQTFAFHEDGGSFFGIADGRPVQIRQAGDGAYEILCPDADADFWRRYFDLDNSYDKIIKGFVDSCLQKSYEAGGVFLSACIRGFGGLRLLRQPVWETVCAFIVSANNRQKRIESIYGRLSYAFGRPIEWAGRTFHSFPPPESLAASDERAMREIGLGYRAPYLIETARAINKRGIADLDGLTYEEALKYLISLKGVGEKVADCVLLFSTRHRVAFPVDTWIDRALREHFGMEGSRSAIKREAQDLFGESAGLAQQFIFHGMRTGIPAA